MIRENIVKRDGKKYRCFYGMVTKIYVKSKYKELPEELNVQKKAPAS